MPNTPAMIAQGAIVACAASNVSEKQKSLADTLLSCAGLVRWIEDEMLMNAVTALSGSGPAYIFLLIEILQKSGESLGLSNDLARDLARQTVIGAAALAATQPDIAAAALRQNVTSPGGTTEAALKVLMSGALQDLFDKALQAAQKRGEELSA
jgi:pyrroline-5-carboxylate reductase